MGKSVHFIKIGSATFAINATPRKIGGVLFLNVAFVANIAVAGGI